jgi:hypothetical protein
MSGKIEFRVDQAKNRLYIRLSGFFRNEHVEPGMADLEAALRELKPNLDVVTDLRDFVPGSPGAAAALTRGGEMIKAKGRRNGIRISGGLMTGLMQFQRLLKGVFNDENTRYAKTLEQADAMLDSWTDET